MPCQLATSSTASRSMCVWHSARAVFASLLDWQCEASVGSMAPSSMQTGIVAPAVVQHSVGNFIRLKLQ